MTRWLLVLLLILAATGCTQGEDPRLAALDEEVARLRLALGESQARRVACEEDDRFLYSDGMRALDSGDASQACGRFQNLVDRYPTSPLASLAKQHVDSCAKAQVNEASGSAVPATDGVPIEVERAWLRENQFGVPMANVRLKNVSDRSIQRYELAIQCYDPDGGVIRHLTNGQEWFVAAEVNLRIPPGGFAKGGPWTMTGFLTCHRFDVVPLSVRFEDGSAWKR